MGPSHVKSGLALGLGAAAIGTVVLDAVPLFDWLMFAAMLGGGALVPDGDIKNSTFTRSFPPVTYPMHLAMKWSHRLVYHWTRRSYDPPSFIGSPRAVRSRTGTQVIQRRKWRGAHRGLSHSIPTAVCVAGTATLGAYALAPLSILPVVCVIVGLVLLAGRGLKLDAVVLLVGYVGVGLWQYGGLTQLIDHVMTQSWLWMLALGLGMIAHDLGDCPTTKGVPLWAPFRWAKAGSPVTFRTGGPFEEYVVRWVLTGLIVYFGFLVLIG